jgi:hypothetical protein
LNLIPNQWFINVFLRKKNYVINLSLASGLKDRSGKSLYLVYSLLFLLNFLRSLKNQKNQNSTEGAANPIKATTLSPLNGFLKSSKVILKIMGYCRTTNTFVKFS